MRIGQWPMTYDNGSWGAICHWSLANSHLSFRSEQVLQRELHDARIVRCPNLTEDWIGYLVITVRRDVGSDVRKQRPEAIRYVVDLPAELEALPFLQSERPYESHVEIKVAGTCNGSSARIPKSPQIRSRKRFPVKPVRERTAGVVVDAITAN